MKKLVFLIIADKKSIYKDIKKTLKSAEISFDIFFENDYDKIIQILMKHNINVLIADLMLKNIDSFSLMKEMGNNSRKYVSKNFSFENFIGSYKKIYEEV